MFSFASHKHTFLHMCTHMHMHVHAHMCTHAHTNTHEHMHVHMHTYTGTCTRAHMHEHACPRAHMHARAHAACTYTRTREHMHALTHMHACTCMCVHTCPHMYRNMHTHAHAHTNTCTAHTCTHLHIQCTRMHTRTHRSRACHRREGTQEARGESRSPPWLCGQPFLLSTPSTEFSNTRRTFCSRPCAHAGREAARGERGACWVTPWAHGTRSRAGRTLSAPPFCSAGLKPRCYKGLFYVWLLKLFSQATDTGI